MSTLKKVLALTLALAMVLSLNVFAAFKDQDKIDTDCVDAVNLMNDLGIMTGDNGYAKPLATITRAEAAAMIYRLMTGRTDASIYNGGKYFTDVVTNSWYDGYVNYCYTMGIVQGKTPTTFDPNAPVTGYEMAKMLLICAGYKSDKQSYTGAMWAANVQNDAFSAGMLENYGMSLSAPAQRQWVAVMFMDALKNVNLVRYMLGELTEVSPTTTLGGKKFGLTTATGVLTSIGGAALTGSTAGDGKFSVNVKGTSTTFTKDVDAVLLGQEVTVLYNANKSNKVYSVRATGTSKTDVANIGDVTIKSGKVTVGTISDVLATGYVAVKNTAANTYAPYTMPTATSEIPTVAGTVRAIDTDGKSGIDYIIVTTSQYGTVAVKDGKYTFGGNTYEAKYVNCVNTVADKSFVKVTANVITGKYDVEAMTSNVALLTKKIDGYTFSGTVYQAATGGVGMDLSKATLGSKIEFYADGNVIVKAKVYEAAATTEMPTLVMLTAKGSTTSVDPYAGSKTTYLMKVLGLDGKITEYQYFDTNTTTSGTNHGNLVVGTVYELKENTGDDAGTYKLVALENGYVAVTGGYKYNKATGGALDYKTGRIGSSVLVPSTAKFFMIDKTKDTSTAPAFDATKWAFSVVTLADLKNDQTVDTYYTTMNSNGILNVVVGAINSGNVTVTTNSVYAVTTSDAYDEYDTTAAKTIRYIDVTYSDGTTAKLKVAAGSTGANYTAKQVVTVVVTDGTAALTKVTPTTTTVEAVATTMVSFNNALKDINSKAVVVLQVGTGTPKFVTMQDIVNAYLDVKGDQATYTALVGNAEKTVDGEYAGVLFFNATAK